METETQTQITRLPDVSKMDVEDVYWIEVSTILKTHRSSDFANWTDGLRYKREAYHYEALRDDIQENGLKYPICIENGCVYNGHHRLAALIELGYTHVPYVKRFADSYGLYDTFEEE